MTRVKKYTVTPFAPPGLDDIEFQDGGAWDTGPSGSSADSGPPGRAVAQDQGTQIPARKGNAIRARALDKAKKSAQIMARLALIKGFNMDMEIKLSDGQYLSGSNLIFLIWHVLTPARDISGLKEFTELMHEARVMPEWIDNPSVRNALSSMGRAPVSVERAEPAIPQRPTYVTEPEPEAMDLRQMPPKRPQAEEVLEDAPLRKRARTGPPEAEPPLRSEVLKARKRRLDAQLNPRDWDESDDSGATTERGSGTE